MKKIMTSLLALAIALLSGCTALGLVAEDKLKYNDIPIPLAGTQGYSAALTTLNAKSPADIGADLDVALAKKVVAALTPAKARLEFLDVAECAVEKVKVCSAISGCKCEAKRSRENLEKTKSVAVEMIAPANAAQ